LITHLTLNIYDKISFAQGGMYNFKRLIMNTKLTPI